MAGAEAPPATGGKLAAARAAAETLSALVNLGYAQSEAASVVAEAQARDPEAATADLIRAALRLLAPKG